MFAGEIILSMLYFVGIQTAPFSSFKGVQKDNGSREEMEIAALPK